MAMSVTGFVFDESDHDVTVSVSESGCVHGVDEEDARREAGVDWLVPWIVASLRWAVRYSPGAMAGPYLVCPSLVVPISGFSKPAKLLALPESVPTNPLLLSLTFSFANDLYGAFDSRVFYGG